MIMPDSVTLSPDLRQHAVTIPTLPEAIIQVAALRSALGFVKRVIPGRHLPVAACSMLVEGVPAVGDNPAYLELTGTDLDKQVRKRVKASVSHPFKALIDPRLLDRMLINLPRLSDLVMALDGIPGSWHLHAASARMTARLPAPAPIDDFPLMDSALGDATPKTIQAQPLSQALARATPYISTEETRYYLNGIYLHQHSNDAGPYVRAVATDGHRMMQTGFPGQMDLGKGIIVPQAAIGILQTLLMGADDAVWSLHRWRSLEQGAVRIATADGTEIIARLIDGDFPQYERVIPAPVPQPIELRTGDLARALRLAMSATNGDKSPGVAFRAAGPLLIEISGSGEAGRIVTHIQAAHPPLVEAKSFEIGLNARYFLALIDSFGGDTLLWHFADREAPQLFTVPDSTDRGVLMPMRV